MNCVSLASRRCAARRLSSVAGRASSPVTAIADAGGADCYGATTAFDDAGHLHVVAECGATGRERLVWGTDASGAWTTRTLDAIGISDVQAQLARGTNGDLALVWTAFTACTSGGSCGDIVTRTIHGTDIGPAVNLTNTPGASEITPYAAVDSKGRLFVAYGSARDVFVVSPGAEPTNITASTPSTWEYPSTIAIDPTTDGPHVLFTRAYPGTQPLNAEIMHAFVTAR